MPFLIIEKGEPYQKGQVIPLRNIELTIGRLATKSEVDVAFGSPYISRKHLSIEYKDNQYHLIDRDSKNGTRLNNVVLEKNRYYPLHNGDRINLAGGNAIVLYHEDDQLRTMTAEPSNVLPGIIFNDERRELKINDKVVELSGNLYALFKLLYNNRGKGVSHDEIRKAVWPDRPIDYGGIPFVTEEEIMTNILRLRKKLQEYPDVIKTLRGFGYMLDIG